MESMPSEYADIQAVRDAFNLGKISAQETANVVTNILTKKPWHTEEWRKKRANLIQSKCTQCLTDEGPFVLQHLWHPRKLGETIRELRASHRIKYEELHPRIEIPIPEPVGETRDACPRCHKLGIYWRKTKNSWRCNDSYCGHEFDNPIKRRMHSAEQSEKWWTEYRNAKQEWYGCFREETDEVILIEALKIGFEEHDRYMSLSDTTTFCKKCAFMWDKRQRKLCKGCNKFVPFNISPENCFNCNESWFDPPKFDEYEM